MSALSRAHRADRDKDVALVIQGVIVGGCCQHELQAGLAEPVNARDFEQEYGRARACGICGGRVLDAEGLPMNPLEKEDR